MPHLSREAVTVAAPPGLFLTSPHVAWGSAPPESGGIGFALIVQVYRLTVGTTSHLRAPSGLRWPQHGTHPPAPVFPAHGAGPRCRPRPRAAAVASIPATLTPTSCACPFAPELAFLWVRIRGTRVAFPTDIMVQFLTAMREAGQGVRGLFHFVPI